METSDGVMRRLLAVDGIALSGAAYAAEEQRLRQIEGDPEAFRKLNGSRKDDESHALQLLTMLPNAFLLSSAGPRGACTGIRFEPDPAYSPSGYEERVVHSMYGVVAVHEPDARLCSIEAKVAQPVVFGYGMLGKLDEGGHLGLVRISVAGSNWKTSQVDLHINGRILFLKSLARDQSTVRTDIRVLQSTPALAEAVAATMR